MNFVLYKPTPKSRTLKCRVVRSILNDKGCASRLLIQLPGGKTKEVNRYYNTQVVVLVPEKKIPKAWKDVLAANPKAKVAVCYQDGLEHVTTLVCTRSLGQLRGLIRSEECCDIYLHKGKTERIGEGKPQVNECYTIYMAGNQQIEFPEDPEHYA